MTPELIFSFANWLALAGWVALVLLPKRRWVTDVWCAWVLPGALAAAYTVIAAVSWGSSEGGFSSLSAVAQLFDSDWLLLAGWIHYLAFDLFVGSWVARDACRRGIRHVWVVPSLVLTFLFGPAGWLSYLGVRAALASSPPAGASALATE
jgi:hypothetical protein